MASDSKDEVIDFVVDESTDFEETAAQYSNLKVEELKELCKSRGLTCTGRKQDLVERLEDFDESGPIWDEIERPIHIPTFRKKSGPTVILEEGVAAVKYFELLFTPELLEQLVSETNRYAAQRLEHPFTSPSSKDRWEPVTVMELKAFLGCLTFMGLCSLGELKDYWSEELGQERIKTVFSYHRFRDIFRFLHCNDNSAALPKGHESHDKLQKVRPIMNLLQQSFQRCWVPHQQNSIDEGMISFTGRSPLKQYMKDKPNKWGFKMWKLVDSISGYLYAFDIYTGKGEEREVGLGEHVVLQMAEHLQLGQPWMLFFDNFFSSIPLIDKLYERGIYATATIRSYRTGVPVEIKEAKLQPGEMIWRMKDPQTVITKWKDTKDVILISSMCRATPGDTDVVKKSQRGTAEKIVRRCPPCITAYWSNMGGVDTNDQLIAYNSMSRKTYRWWLPIFFDMLKEAVVNAWIIQKNQPNAMKIGQKEFRVELF
ncbi:piggyBac transposable element-derived protein 4-like [Rhopilema esculentum]|uniref:piggyBac transposable element-derived protein 4-like n=1 Tax=Rhopilema esculentum TaxID=499914 RepID=UPI0031DC9CDB|eukprot:gene9935-18543_t